ncbi:MAG: coenzyme F420-0:L-glutamate ligase [Chloroflexi bacterium]|jgi:coenzyme F420-0:L-glutamate ligase / coenzyme F420-1:gamma-L-glutamate ligase|nr:coenzyme F420-0:L-glutamate ligase [Chloroflexota bacterium]MBT4074847.1 coenzyme F420-0:L-glutamate ligase [Chloroflexota bacterium]MBT4514475.1 coenzyme F420-0:L-glutamate ligase [Chloroflexota bacterium]MBT5318921.1 coenzyme F420-0:L-glutamate ligase [Chloroflexota bacterium]MBT6681012.1 coenzyme F420-0:L-glutamate ligase [Chloroflexota bacterium]
MTNSIEIIGVEGLPEIREGDELASLIYEACGRQGTPLESGDVIVLAQKIVSKSEGAVVDLDTVTPSSRALELAEVVKKDPRLVEVILQQTANIIRSAPGVLITESIHGLVCANAGVDSSNTASNDQAITLPADPDGSARMLMNALGALTGVRTGVIISDSFGRPWREGSTNVAIGVAGIESLHDSRGQTDDHGRVLKATVVAVADELASAAQLVMGEFGRVPVAVVRGARLTESDSSGAKSLQRSPETDLFR